MLPDPRPPLYFDDVWRVYTVIPAGSTITLPVASRIANVPADRSYRHHDPFTVMEQLARPIRIGAYTQPVTDVTSFDELMKANQGSKVRLDIIRGWGRQKGYIDIPARK